MAVEQLDVAVRRTKDGAAVMRAVAELRYRIVTGELGGGEQLRQERMAELLNMSRVPVREALRVLADQGLLEHRVHTGYFVRKRPADELRQIYVMLAFLEGQVLADIAPADSATVERMRAINAEMATYVESADWGPMVDLNRRFHFEIFRLTGQNVMLAELERLWTIAAPYIAQKYAIVEMREQAIAEHERMIEALASGDRVELLRQFDEHRTQRPVR
jgi:DNA-binding GntR family transcriptional regulator